jgi:very-short-patch-repair endonuclease
MRGPDRTGTGRARQLRVAQTDAERFLWARLRNRQLAGHKFVRQQPLGRYVCDFVCRERFLVVELDGSQHAESASDVERDGWLSGQGYRVLRFWNNDVLSNTEGALTTIAAVLEE